MSKIISRDDALLDILAKVNKNHFKLTGLLEKDWRIKYVSIENSIQIIDKNLLSLININKQSDLERINKYLKKK